MKATSAVLVVLLAVVCAGQTCEQRAAGLNAPVFVEVSGYEAGRDRCWAVSCPANLQGVVGTRWMDVAACCDSVSVLGTPYGGQHGPPPPGVPFQGTADIRLTSRAAAVPDRGGFGLVVYCAPRSQDVTVEVAGQYGSAPAVAALSGGGFVVAWTHSKQESWGQRRELHAQQYDEAGEPVGRLTIPHPQRGTVHGPAAPLALPSGGYVIAYGRYYAQFSSSAWHGLVGRLYTSAASMGPEFPVLQMSSAYTRLPGTSLRNGGFSVAWIRNGPLAQDFTAAAAPVGTPHTLTQSEQQHYFRSLSEAVLADGRTVRVTADSAGRVVATVQ